MVTVVAGADSQPLEGLAGKTVAAVREAFASLYNIASDATATINGRTARESDVLSEGDNLAFAKPTAQKG